MVFTTVAYVLIIPEGIKMVSEGRDVISFDITKIVFVAMGILFIIIGNYMPKTRRNSVVGIRCKWTRYNDATWSKSNRFASYLTVAVSVIAIVLSLTMSDVMMAGALTFFGSYFILYNKDPDTRAKEQTNDTELRTAQNN